ncbi:Pol Polyprotein [Phytophthora cinnamomi]|uniref:Pol Polyprotein n=2 Tax=Phytophthora cinnamomi TaxID=4785 RepID=UPI003559A439|nr:Pol Polyprotein [Phytophthora cinnamomi]
MWWGGPTGKAPPTGEVMTFPPVRGLRYMFMKDMAAYLRRTSDATKPFQIDSPRFQSLTEMLVQTGALVPTDKRSHRLSDKALARVVIDITSPTPVPDHWVPSLTEGALRALLADERIAELRVKIELQLGNGKFKPMKVNPYTSKEGSHAGVTPPYLPDGSQAALGPVTAVYDSSSKFREDPDEAIAKMVAEAEAKSKAKKADELEYITNGDEEGVSNEEEDGGSNDEDEGSDDDEEEEEDDSDEEEDETDEIEE